MSSESAELVERARGGSRDAFAVLYDRHARLVRAICFDFTGQLSTAEDLSQDVFLKAYERLGQPRQPERFVPWLCEIARARVTIGIGGINASPMWRRQMYWRN